MRVALPKPGAGYQATGTWRLQRPPVMSALRLAVVPVDNESCTQRHMGYLLLLSFVSLDCYARARKQSAMEGPPDQRTSSSDEGVPDVPSSPHSDKADR